MTNEETLTLYGEGKEAWNKWAAEALAEITGAKDGNEKYKIEQKYMAVFDLELLNYSINCNGFIFPSEVHINSSNTKKGNLRFTSCEFHSTLLSEYIEYKYVIFKDVKFYNSVQFTSSKFMSCNFLQCIFFGYAMFSYAVFEVTADFKNTEFKDSVNFTKSDFQVSLDLQGVKFSYLPIALGANFKETPHFDGVQFPDVFKKSYDSVSFYRTFRQLAAKSGDQEREIDFFAGELKSRSEWWMTGWVWFYDKFSDFGRSIGRPLAALLFIVFISFNVFLTKHEPLWTKSLILDKFTCNVNMQSDPRSAALQLALEKSFPLISSNSEKSKQNMICLYGGEKDLPNIPDSIALFVFFQTLISLVLLFLAGLGLRNRFRLK